MNNGIRGRVVDPDAIYGKSAYEIAVMHGFDGTEEEWLESLHADWDERADEAKESIDNEVDNVIVPEAKEELERAKTEAVAAAISDIEKAVVAKDESEVLLWQNTPWWDTDAEMEKLTEYGDNSYIELGEIPESVDRLRIVFSDTSTGVTIMPSLTLKMGESGKVQYTDGSTTFTRTVHAQDNKIYFYGLIPTNVCVPYRIYGVKNKEISVRLTDEDKAEIVNEVLLNFTNVSQDWQTITFKIGGLSFTAETGMTWAEWCDTDASYYDDGLKFYILGGYVEGESVEVRLANGEYVHPTDIIIPDYTYLW